MVDVDSLPKRLQERWINWVNQVPVFRFNSRKYDLNMVKYYFVHIISDISDVNIAKKDNFYRFLITPRLKFLDIKKTTLLLVLVTMTGVRQMNVRPKSLSFHTNG